MQWRKSGRLEWLESERLNAIGLRHGWFSRSGGVSLGVFAGLNVKRGFADSDENVTENRRRALDSLGGDPKDLIFIKHAHGTKILRADKKMIGTDQLADAIIATKSQLFLGQGTADCATIILADPEKKCVALVHAGWRSATAGILAKVVRQLGQLGCEPADLVAALGPMVCGQHYQFGPEVYDYFDKRYVSRTDGKPRSELASASLLQGKLYLDLRRFCADQLAAAGVKTIDTLDVCTIEDERFFSHRRDHDGQNECGRFLTLVSS